MIDPVIAGVMQLVQGFLNFLFLRFLSHQFGIYRIEETHFTGVLSLGENVADVLFVLRIFPFQSFALALEVVVIEFMVFLHRLAHEGHVSVFHLQKGQIRIELIEQHRLFDGIAAMRVAVLAGVIDVLSFLRSFGTHRMGFAFTAASAARQ